MLVFSFIIFLLSLPLVFVIRAVKGYNDVRVSSRQEFALCAPSTLTGVFFGCVLIYVNRYSLLGYSDWYHPSLSTLGIRELWLGYLLVGGVSGVFALAIAVFLGVRGEEAGHDLRDGSLKRSSNFRLFYEAGKRFPEMEKQDPAEAIRVVRQYLDTLPGDAQFEVLKGLRNLGWTDLFANELADWLCGELNWLLSGEGERLMEDHPRGQRDTVGQLGTLLLPLLARHPHLAAMLSEHESHLTEQASSLQQEVDELSGAHNAYTRKAGELRGVTQRREEIAQLLDETPEHDEQ